MITLINKKFRFSIPLVVIVLSTAGNASEWKGEGGAGLVLASGNSDSKTLNGTLTLNKKLEYWDHTIDAAFNLAENDGEDSAESYLLAYDAKYAFTQRQFFFGDGRYLDDKFDSFDRIITLSLGYGYYIYQLKNLSWSISVGPGYRDTSIDTTGEDISSAALVGNSDYTYKITETTSLTNKSRFELTDENSYLQNIAGISVQMNRSFSIKLTYDVRHNTDPEPGDEKTDSITSINMVYKL